MPIYLRHVDTKTSVNPRAFYAHQNTEIDTGERNERERERGGAISYCLEPIQIPVLTKGADILNTQILLPAKP